MKISDFDANTIEYLKITDFENFFDVVKDDRGFYVFNMNSNLYFEIDSSSLPTFTCDHRMHWPLISYRIYGTTRLTWLLWKLNDVNAGNIFNPKEPGETLKYLPNQYVEGIVAQLNEFDE